MSAPITLRYPRRDVTPRDVFTQETFERLTAHLFSWQQSPGAIGGLHLHPCWSETSSLTRRYQGQTTWSSQWLLDGVLRLARQTGDGRWQRMAHDIAANLLFLQAPEGGFIHASSEYEPTYTCHETCPIHQGMPVLALLQYAEWSGAREDLREAIRPAIDLHWAWFQDWWWQRGNGWKAPLELPGWCGVTNQDLTIVAALALYGKVYGDFGRYEEIGRPVLDAYLSPAYYHEALGLFERGDRENFVERTNYHDIILDMLEIVHECTGDERLPAVMARVVQGFEQARYVAGDGFTHLAWGAETHEDDKSRVANWILEPRTLVAYPALLGNIQRQLDRQPRAETLTLQGELKKTLAAYVFADGTMPGSLGKTALLSIVPGGDVIRLWRFLIEELGEQVETPAPRAAVRVKRSMDDLEWSAGAKLWRIAEGGERRFGGLKNNPGAIAIGPEEVLPGADFSLLDEPEYVEEVETPKA